jgi:hypothetical protein
MKSINKLKYRLSIFQLKKKKHGKGRETETTQNGLRKTQKTKSIQQE